MPLAAGLVRGFNVDRLDKLPQRIGGILCDEVVELRFALGVVAGDSHNILGIFCYKVAILIHKRLLHPLCMVDVHTKNDGFGKTVVLLQKASDALCHGNGTLINDEILVVVLGIILTVINLIAIDIPLSRCGTPAFQIFVQTDTENFVRCKETVVDTCFRLYV